MMIDTFYIQHENLDVSSSPNTYPPLEDILEKEEDIINTFINAISFIL